MVLTAFLATSCRGQHTYGLAYLHLIKAIELPGVRGRIDHIDEDTLHQIAYISALGNNTLEVVDLKAGRLIHTIHGLSEPQGVAYLPDQHQIFVANGGNGDCYFFDASTFHKTSTLHLSSDADDVRYDPSSRVIYVGYGQGGIALIDAITHQEVGTIALPVHPESFQFDASAHNIYVNLPDARLVGVADLVHRTLTKRWRRLIPESNFPMALDARGHRLFIGYRVPARLMVLNSRNGEAVSELPMTGDADDMYFDPQSKRLYVSGGGGQIDIFQQVNANSYQQIAEIPTRPGARTSLLVPSQSLFLLAERAESGKPAQVLLYRTH